MRLLLSSALFSVLGVSLMLLYGCDTVSYYSQGIKGHFHLVSQVQPINEIVNHKDTPTETRQLLQQAKLARDFAINTLALPDNNSYQGYADLKRKQVTWNVIATKALSLEPYQSCFPITGCLSYRGYFTESAAQQFAKELQAEQYETFIGGSSAYSTLGWFEDPIVSPMLRFGEIRLIETLFHELAHQRLYIKDDSDFNEAFATTVGQNGVREWLRQTNPKALPKYNQYLLRHTDFIALLGHKAKQLKDLYSGPLNNDEKLKKKHQLLTQLKEEYLHYKQKYNGNKGFDKWFDKPVNNPRLAMVAVYHELVPDFERWLKACNNNYSRFYQTIEDIANLPKEQRITVLKRIARCNKES